MQSDSTPAKFGQYETHSLLATGSSAQVWAATDAAGAQVALKIARTERHRATLLREAEVLGYGSHPHLVKLLDFAPDGEWIALERIEGGLLDEWAKDKPPEEIVRIAFELMDTLEYLHGHSVIHGDLKPGNVIVDSRGHARLLDLGIATLPGDEVSSFRGTLGFAAPELLRGEQPTTHTDIYGFGALLYSCLTGRTPFVAPDPAALTYLPLVSLPPPPATFRPDLPVSLNQLVLALLARDPQRRPGSLARIRDALSRTMIRLSEPIFGMHDQREDLRRAVVGAADGEARVVVLYGPPGSGRRTLIGEAVEYARREGLPYLKGGDLRKALDTLRTTKRSVCMVHRGGNSGTTKLAKIVLKERLPCLLLLHSERPVPDLAKLGAIQITPSPLSLANVTTLCTLHNVDPSLADDWWGASLGLPASVLGYIRAEKRSLSGEPFDTNVLPPASRKVYKALQTVGTSTVSALAGALSMSEHLLLDHCEILFAEKLIKPANDGLAIKLIT